VTRCPGSRCSRGMGVAIFVQTAVALSLTAEGFCSLLKDGRPATENPWRSQFLGHPRPSAVLRLPSSAPALAGAGVVFYAPLEEGDRLGDGEGKQEHHQYESPKFLHQKILGIKLKQLAHPENRY
jgi:hypothetical protein